MNHAPWNSLLLMSTCCSSVFSYFGFTIHLKPLDFLLVPACLDEYGLHPGCVNSGNERSKRRKSPDNSVGGWWHIFGHNSNQRLKMWSVANPLLWLVIFAFGTYYISPSRPWFYTTIHYFRAHFPLIICHKLPRMLLFDWLRFWDTGV